MARILANLSFNTILDNFLEFILVVGVDASTGLGHQAQLCPAVQSWIMMNSAIDSQLSADDYGTATGVDFYRKVII
ncbi:hypothetical protein [Microbulbifer epialgicus]|uniref:Uncharacterized protein n=1 Tax=Microbulbifer epialgicus TaxID=393907 RepID=A0ABV4P114_9GAMM